MRAALVTASVFIVLLGTFPAVANAKGGSGGNGGNPGHGGGGGPTPSAICGSSSSITNCGFDVSYPQCPASNLSAYSAAFAIVGVNGGLANDYNTCLSGELSWALGFPGLTVGGSTQLGVSLYVNTADPGNMYNNQPVADWPTSGGGGGYGSCNTTDQIVTVRVKGHYVTNSYVVGANSAACAWQYGYNMVQGLASSVYDTSITRQTLPGDISAFEKAAATTTPGAYAWWLDVETANSWMGTSMNVADLQGMIAGFQAASVATVGVYSTSSQWGSITGGFQSGTPVWIPGASSESGAQTNCSLPSFTGGPVILTQWTGTLDSDYFCPALSS